MTSIVPTDVRDRIVQAILVKDRIIRFNSTILAGVALMVAVLFAAIGILDQKEGGVAAAYISDKALYAGAGVFALLGIFYSKRAFLGIAGAEIEQVVQSLDCRVKERKEFYPAVLEQVKQIRKNPSRNDLIDDEHELMGVLAHGLDHIKAEPSMKSEITLKQLENKKWNYTIISLVLFCLSVTALLMRDKIEERYSIISQKITVYVAGSVGVLSLMATVISSANAYMLHEKNLMRRARGEDINPRQRA